MSRATQSRTGRVEPLKFQVHLASPSSIVSTARRYAAGDAELTASIGGNATKVVTRLEQHVVPEVPARFPVPLMDDENKGVVATRLIYLRVGSGGDFLDAAWIASAINVGWKDIAVITSLTDFPIGLDVEKLSAIHRYPQWTHGNEAVRMIEDALVANPDAEEPIVLIIAPKVLTTMRSGATSSIETGTRVGVGTGIVSDVADAGLRRIINDPPRGVEVVEYISEASQSSYGGLVVDCGLATTLRQSAIGVGNEDSRPAYEARFRLISDQESLRGTLMVAEGGYAILVDDLVGTLEVTEGEGANKTSLTSGLAVVGIDESIITPRMALDYVVARMSGLGDDQVYRDVLTSGPTRAYSRRLLDRLEREVYATIPHPDRLIISRAGPLMGDGGLYGARFINGWVRTYGSEGGWTFPGIVMGCILGQLGDAGYGSDALSRWLLAWEAHVKVTGSECLDTVPNTAQMGEWGLVTTSGNSEIYTNMWSHFTHTVSRVMEALDMPRYVSFSSAGAISRAKPILNYVYQDWPSPPSQAVLEAAVRHTVPDEREVQLEGEEWEDLVDETVEEPAVEPTDSDRGDILYMVDMRLPPSSDVTLDSSYLVTIPLTSMDNEDADREDLSELPPLDLGTIVEMQDEWRHTVRPIVIPIPALVM